MSRAFLASETGAASVEFAFAASAFFLLLFGTTEFGRLMLTYHQVADAARAGSRYAVVHGASSGSPATTSQISAVVAAAEPLVTTAEVSVAYAPNNNPGSQVTVTVNHSFSYLFGLMTPSSFLISSVSTMRISQ